MVIAQLDTIDATPPDLLFTALRLVRHAKRTGLSLGRVIHEAAYYTAARGDIYELSNEQLNRWLEQSHNMSLTR